MTLLRTFTLMGATLTMGLVAGVFALYAHTIMPGLRKTDDRTFVAAFQQTDRAIINPWFMITAFGGALVLTLVAGIANRGTPALPWIAAAFGLHLVAVAITVTVNVPLNDAIKAAGDPARIDVAQVRAQFNEARWAAWNLVRVATSGPAFGLLAWALVLCGRANPCAGLACRGRQPVQHAGGDLGQRGELVAAEAVEDQLPHRLDVGRGGPLDGGATGRGEDRERAPGVARTVRTGDQATSLHPGELVRDPALLPGQRVGDLEHPHRPSGASLSTTSTS